MRRIICSPTTVPALDPRDLTWMLRRSRWWTGWATSAEGKERCDMLETIQATPLRSLKQGSIVLLIRLCNRAIASYQHCTGYAKVWKHYRRELTKLLSPETSMYVDNMLFKVKDALKFLKAAGYLNNRQWRVLNGAPRGVIRYELLKMDNLKMDITIPRNVEHALHIGLKDKRISSRIVLKYCVIE